MSYNLNTMMGLTLLEDEDYYNWDEALLMDDGNIGLTPTTASEEHIIELIVKATDLWAMVAEVEECQSGSVFDNPDSKSAMAMNFVYKSLTEFHKCEPQG